MIDFSRFLFIGSMILLVTVLMSVTQDVKADVLSCNAWGGGRFKGKVIESLPNGVYKFKSDEGKTVLFNYCGCVVEEE